jgi:hypothetical protein
VEKAEEAKEAIRFNCVSASLRETYGERQIKAEEAEKVEEAKETKKFNSVTARNLWRMANRG